MEFNPQWLVGNKELQDYFLAQANEQQQYHKQQLDHWSDIKKAVLEAQKAPTTVPVSPPVHVPEVKNEPPAPPAKKIVHEKPIPPPVTLATSTSPPLVQEEPKPVVVEPVKEEPKPVVVTPPPLPVSVMKEEPKPVVVIPPPFVKEEPKPVAVAEPVAVVEPVKPVAVIEPVKPVAVVEPVKEEPKPFVSTFTTQARTSSQAPSARAPSPAPTAEPRAPSQTPAPPGPPMPTAAPAKSGIAARMAMFEQFSTNTGPANNAGGSVASRAAMFNRPSAATTSGPPPRDPSRAPAPFSTRTSMATTTPTTHTGSAASIAQALERRSSTQYETIHQPPTTTPRIHIEVKSVPAPPATPTAASQSISSSFSIPPPTPGPPIVGEIKKSDEEEFARATGPSRANPIAKRMSILQAKTLTPSSLTTTLTPASPATPATSAPQATASPSLVPLVKGRAVFDYAGNPDQKVLNMKKDDLFIILAQDGDWWPVKPITIDGEILNEEGFVPRNFIEVIADGPLDGSAGATAAPGGLKQPPPPPPPRKSTVVDTPAVSKATPPPFSPGGNQFGTGTQLFTPKTQETTTPIVVVVDTPAPAEPEQIEEDELKEELEFHWCIAKYDYFPPEGGPEDGTSFLRMTKGRRYQIIGNIVTEGWWFARDPSNEQSGYVPSNFCSLSDQ